MLETIAFIKQHIQDCVHYRTSIEERIDFESAIHFVPFGKEVYRFAMGYTLEELRVTEEELRASLLLLAVLLHKEDHRFVHGHETLLHVNSTLQTHEVITL